MTMSSASIKPSCNSLIASLPSVEYDRLVPHLEMVSLDTGALLPTSSTCGRLLYFPVDCAVSVQQAEDDDGLSELAITGNEGVVGISLVLLGEEALNRSTVISAGRAYRLESEILATNFPLDSQLRQALFSYAQVLITQIGQNAYCRNHHSHEQRLSRWLLTIADHAVLYQVRVHFQLIADLMAIEVGNVHKVAHDMQGNGLNIDGQHLVLTDRRALLECSCSCYEMLRTKTDHWLA